MELSQQSDAERETDQAIASLRDSVHDVGVDVHVHLDAPAAPKSDKRSLPTWVTILIALGVPAMLAEVIRRMMG